MRRAWEITGWEPTVQQIPVHSPRDVNSSPPSRSKRLLGGGRELSHRLQHGEALERGARQTCHAFERSLHQRRQRPAQDMGDTSHAGMLSRDGARQQNPSPRKTESSPQYIQVPPYVDGEGSLLAYDSINCQAKAVSSISMRSQSEYGRQPTRHPSSKVPTIMSGSAMTPSRQAAALRFASPNANASSGVAFVGSYANQSALTSAYMETVTSSASARNGG